MSAQALEVLFDTGSASERAMPNALVDRYGKLRLGRPCIMGNMVASVDGVVALPGAGESGGIVSGHSEADRFVMGLLRAHADAVLVGAGTVRAAKGDAWTPEHAHPASSVAFAELRARFGLSPRPRLVVVTASGNLGDAGSDELQGALCVTTAKGAERLQPRGVEHLIVPGEGDNVSVASALRALRERGMSVVLCEGGPGLLGQLIGNSLLDELFLTLSPKLFGRWAADGRMALTDGPDLNGRTLDLKSVRRAGSQLFLRYGAA